MATFPEENPNPVMRLGRDDRILFANSSARNIPGLVDINRNALTSVMVAALRSASVADASQSTEYHAAGRTYYFAVTPVAGKPYMNVYGRDVTDERLAQQQTIDVAKFPEENPNPVLRIGRDGAVLFANSSSRAVAGLLRGNGEIHSPDLASVVAAATASETTQSIEISLANRHYAFTATPIKDRAYINIYGRDITEEHKANTEIQRIKILNQRILDNLADGIITISDERIVTSINPAALKQLAISDEKAVGCNISQLFNANNSWITEAIFQRTPSEEPGIWLDRELINRAGQKISVNITISALGGVGTGQMLVIEDITREKRIKGTMVRFMSDQVVEQLLDIDETVLGGNIQDATILFSDIRQFTDLSHRLGAREMVGVLNAYFSNMVDVIFERGGTLDKFIGDAIMAVFGAPFVSPDDPLRAANAGVDMLSRLAKFNELRGGIDHPKIQIGIGIDTGSVIAGTIGSPKRMDYTVIGEPVNLASRIEAANKYYGTNLLISENTRSRLDWPGRMREIDQVRLHGIAAPVRLFEILDHHNKVSFPNLDTVIATFAEGLAAYRQGNWQEGAQAFAEALKAHPGDRPTQIYLARCWSCLARPPGPNWSSITGLEKN